MAVRRGRRELSDEERAEKRAAEREHMQAAIEALRTSEGWKRWLKVRRHFHTYSFHNQLLIANQCPEATRVAGFRSWLTIGYAVRKGEKGIRIWAPCPPSKKQLAEWKRAGANPLEKPNTYFRLVAVFDRSQVDAFARVPRRAGRAGAAQRADRRRCSRPALPAAHHLWHLDRLAHHSGRDSRPRRGLLRAVDARRFESSRSQRSSRPTPRSASASTSLPTRLVRHSHQDDDPKLTYAEEEVIAESVAYTVCSTVGLDTAGSSIPYLATWGEGAEGEPIERYAALIDRLARRLEDVALAAAN